MGGPIILWEVDLVNRPNSFLSWDSWSALFTKRAISDLALSQPTYKTMIFQTISVEKSDLQLTMAVKCWYTIPTGVLQ